MLTYIVTAIIVYFLIPYLRWRASFKNFNITCDEWYDKPFLPVYCLLVFLWSQAIQRSPLSDDSQIRE